MAPIGVASAKRLLRDISEESQRRDDRLVVGLLHAASTNQVGTTDIASNPTGAPISFSPSNLPAIVTRLADNGTGYPHLQQYNALRVVAPRFGVRAFRAQRSSKVQVDAANGTWRSQGTLTTKSRGVYVEAGASTAIRKTL